ncbi:MAG: YceI family protein [Saprospiraceae bacterium]
MKKTFNILLVALIMLVACMLTSSLQAQSTKTIITNTGSMKLSGTSTMHDWTMNGIFQVEGKFKLSDGSDQLQSLNELSFLLPVENLKSDRKKLDETAYKALKTDQYKDILFTMTSARITDVQNNKYFISAQGDLTIAGVTNPITMNVCWQLNPDKTIICTGIQKLKMTAFQVKPPSFLGFMKTGDDISLDFAFQFKS